MGQEAQYLALLLRAECVEPIDAFGHRPQSLGEFVERHVAFVIAASRGTGGVQPR
jgi:hypothetical protein